MAERAPDPEGASWPNGPEPRPTSLLWVIEISTDPASSTETRRTLLPTPPAPYRDAREAQLP